jgi:hypothetical protein
MPVMHDRNVAGSRNAGHGKGHCEGEVEMQNIDVLLSDQFPHLEREAGSKRVLDLRQRKHLGVGRKIVEPMAVPGES